MERKQLLRDNIFVKREGFQRSEMHQKDQKICKILKEIIISLTKQTPVKLGTYIPLDGEPNLTSLFRDQYFAEKGYEFFAPKIQYSVLNFVKLLENDLKERNDIDKLVQPKSNKISIPEIILVPGLAYSYQGYRLGFGKGYYDRYIANNGHHKFAKLGICYHQDLLEFLPHQNHDKKMDYIVTEQTIIEL